MARLLRRAQAVARLRHPNLVRLLPLPGGAGLAPVVGNARRLADFTLPAGTFKRFDLEQVVRLLLDVLSGLSALHEVVTDGEGFVHGQVSPQNIYIDEHGTARLVPLLNAHSRPGAKVEEPSYAAPERLLTDAVDARADVFSVGVMLWEALAGKRLFPEASPAGLLARSSTKPESIRLPANLRWATSLCAIAERAVARDPAARFVSVLELSNAMASAAAQQLSKVDTDAWQEEAPTPVFQPQLHLAKLRTSTPPPSVVTIGASASVPATETASTASEAAAESVEVVTGGRGARVVVTAVAALSLGAAALFVLPRVPSNWRRVAAASPAVFTLPTAAPVTAPARVAPRPAPVAATPVAPPAPPAVAVSAVSPAPSVDVSAPKPKPAKAAPRAKPAMNAGVKTRDRTNDYGI